MTKRVHVRVNVANESVWKKWEHVFHLTFNFSSCSRTNLFTMQCVIFTGISAVTRGHGFYRKRGKDRGGSERGEEYRRERGDKLAANVEAILEAASGLRYGTTARIGRWISCFATMVSQRIEKRYRRSDSSRPWLRRRVSCWQRLRSENLIKISTQVILSSNNFKMLE